MSDVAKRAMGEFRDDMTDRMWEEYVRCRGACCVATLLHKMKRRGKDYCFGVISMCLEWNIDRKLSTITVDNCSTNDAMIRLLLNKLDTSSLMLNGSTLYMRYAAHILNLIVQDGMAESMLAKFNSYWTNVNVVMAAAAILDLRYKMKLLEFYYPNIYGDNSNLEIEIIKNLCYDLLDEYRDVDESPVDNEASSHMPASTSNYVTQMKCRLSGAMPSFDLFVNNISSSSKKHRSARMEFDHFIDKGVLKRSEAFDILAWWKSNGLKYLTLQRIAEMF
ncbi:hypothetical protein SO802_031973 [Lithocarpus litseifolius]|uniref:Uncharacterized protein n=1 Tax=Lithocarpus litseifolius TaxID=425828 RepID=A0AAW2BPA3_9ROSI